MALEKFFPFRSVSGDRKYSAEDWAAYFEQFIRDGVFYSDANRLKVVKNEEMKVKVNTGAGFIKGRMYLLEQEKIITLDAADGVLDRIDRIVLRCDYINRLMTVEKKQGSYSETPLAPELVRSADLYELALADIYIAAGAIEISAANITDQRLNNSLCGIVTGLIDQADTKEIFNQFQAYLQEFKETSQEEYEYWFENIKDVLSEDAAGNLLKQIETKASKQEVEVERARIDVLTKTGTDSISSYAELKDLRVGADGTTYETAGEAVRGQIGELRSDLKRLQMCSKWWKDGDDIFTSLSESKRADFMRILNFNVKAYTPNVTVKIYDCKINSDGSFYFGLIWSCIDGSSSFPITLPASDTVTTYTKSLKYKRGKIDISITYTTNGNVTKRLTTDTQYIGVNVSYDGTIFDNGNFDNRIISKIYLGDDVSEIKLIRIQNVNPSTSGSSFWYYAQYLVTLKSGEIKTITKSSTTQKTGIIEDNLDNYAVIHIDSDVLAEYGTQLQTANVVLNLNKASYYLNASSSGDSNTIKNNLCSDGVDNLPNCEIYKNGVSALANYGKDNVRYRFEVGKERKNIHIFFEYQWTSPPVYVDNSQYYGIAKVYGDLVRVVQYFRKVNDESLRRAQIIGTDNIRIGSASLSISEKFDKISSGNMAFWIQYIGETATENSDVCCRFDNGTVTIFHSETEEVIGIATYLPTDSVDSLIISLNNIEGILCGAIETTGHVCSELVLSEEDVTFTMSKTYKDSSNVNQYDYVKLGVYYSLDTSWHTCEIIVDVDNEKSYMAIDGRTTSSPIRLDISTNQFIEIGGVFNGLETPIRVRNLEINYDSFGDAEIVQSVAPPYTAMPQLISNHNPRLLIFEGHGVDVGVDANAPYSDNMAVTTDRLNKVFSKLNEKGYIPVTWEEIITWKTGNGKLPKRCYNIMMDDWRFENYVNYEKRKPFEKYNVKAGLAVVPTVKDLTETVEIDSVQYRVVDIIKMTMNAGWYPCSHTKNHRNNLDVSPSSLEALLKEDALANNLYGIYSDVIVYPYGGYNDLVGREVERSSFKIGVNIVINTYNCKMTNNSNLGRVEIGTRQEIEDVIAPIV